MRQAGIIAAAGIYALEHNVERLAEDHANARLFAESLRNLPGIKVDPQEVETNIVFFDIAGTGMTADPFCDALKKRGIDLGGAGTRIRIVTHLDVSREDIMAAEIGRAHVCTPVTNAHLVCRLLLEKKNHLTTL